ncbi:protein late bloomer [Drosophila grimshawi]|uniref:GH20388 n=1 Tax=Drosophila grimshawi TaxID=7222 RepID=B4J3Y1_DROGR|nr:protein late bloomer [Drosophila grimshawi]EDW01564.1 GH20388 [Drosophila grimshawi]
MIDCYNTIKYTGLLSNLLYMLLAIGVMFAAGLSLQMAEPNTPEHTYFVESIVLGATICVIVIFGCYGLVCNLLSVNIIFTCFILIVLGVEYLQLHNYHPHMRYSGVLQQLDLTQAWHNLDIHPQRMQQYEQQQQCCGYNNVRDYKRLQLPIPQSCYQQPGNAKLFTRGCEATLIHRQNSIQYRDKLFMWCIIGLEIFILVQTIVVSVMLHKLRQRQRHARQQVPPGVRREPRANHVGSRAHLLEDA